MPDAESRLRVSPRPRRDDARLLLPPVLIWDLPVRLFHLVFAGGIASAAVIALVLGDDGSLFPHHAMIRLTVAVAFALRVAWGFVGSRASRRSRSDPRRTLRCGSTPCRRYTQSTRPAECSAPRNFPVSS